MLLALLGSPGIAATFIPRNFSPPDITTTIPKLTRAYTLDPANGLERRLFGTLGPSVAYSLENCGKYLCFTIDPNWDRVIITRNDWSVGAYGTSGSGDTQFKGPRDIDIYYNGIVVIADTGNSRLRFLNWLDGVVYVPGSQTPCILTPGQDPIVPIDLGSVGPGEGFAFKRPEGVSVDDSGTPTESPGTPTDDVLWVADTGNNRIYRLHVNFEQTTAESLGVYGSLGAGVAQFNHPRRVVRGRAAINGDPSTTRNTDELFILDSGNDRIVKLRCGFSQNLATATWEKTFQLPPVADLRSLAVDAWGNLYVTDATTNSVLKLTSSLELLAEYGHYGLGVQDGSMCAPLDFRPQFRQYNWTSPPQLIGTNFALLNEEWGDRTGAQGYLLGVDVTDAIASKLASGGGEWIHYCLTDHAFVKVVLLDSAGSTIRVLESGSVFHGSGTDSLFWNGLKSDSTTASCGTYRFRITPRSGYSATFDSTAAVEGTFDFGAPTLATYHIYTEPAAGDFYLNGGRVGTGSSGFAAACSTCTPGASLDLSAPIFQNIGGVRYRFASWSDGGAMSHTVKITRDSTITLRLIADSPPAPPFAAPYVSLDVGINPYAIVSADLNRDGIADLAVANKGSNSVSVLLGRGDGTFVSQFTYTTGSLPRGLAAGDLNGDGRTDLAVACEGSNSITLLYGLGDGAFTNGPVEATELGPWMLAVGDLNGDGRDDIAVPNYSSGLVSVFLQLPGGTLAPRVNYAAGESPICVRMVKLRGAAAPMDLVVADYATASVEVLLGDGAGHLGAPTTYAVGNNPYHIAVQDLSSDGYPDIVVANRGSATISVLRGTGVGGLTDRQDYSVGPEPTSVVISDFNRDGLLDAATADYGGNTISILLGAAGGVLGPRTVCATPYLPYAIAAVDVNSDFRSDLAIASYGSNVVAVFPGGGDGSFGVLRQFPTGGVPDAVGAGDLNGDGRVDLVACNWQDNTVSVLIGTGAGNFAPKVDYATGLAPRAVSVVDVTGDGLADLVVANSTSNSVSIFRGVGGGAFAARVDYSTGVYPIGVAVSDLNADGLADVVTSNNDGNSVSVLLGVGGGVLGARTDIPVGMGPGRPVISDLNEDGKPDIAVPHYSPGAVALLPGNGDGTFGSIIEIPTPGSASQVVTADMDRDGHPDLVVNAGGIAILANAGQGEFWVRQAYSPGSAYALAVADFSGDGWLDIATANYEQGTVSVMVGRGDGTVGAKTDYGFGSPRSPIDIVAADLSGDSRPDIATADWAGNTGVNVLLNKLSVTGINAASLPPAAFALRQNRPNPFNPETLIDFDLPAPAHAKLYIFDVAGRLVARLVDKQLPAGPHRAVWAGRDLYGRSVASGVYLYRLEAGRSVSSRRMVLLK